MLGLALLISAGIGAIAGGIQGYADYQEAENKRTLIDKQIGMQNEQLRQTKLSNAYGALNTASSMALSNEIQKDGIDSMVRSYNTQIDSYANQATRNVGAYRARIATTGFRRSGSNLSALNNAKFDVASQLTLANENLRSNRISSGASAMSAQSQYMSNLQGYKMNVSNAIASNNLTIEYMKEQRKQIGHENVVNSIASGSMFGFAEGALSYVGGAVSNNDLDFEGWK